MRAQSILAVGFLSMIVASGVVKATDSFASEAQRTDVFERVGAGGCLYRPISVQPGEATVAGVERGKVDVITRIGTGGSIYSSSQVKTGGGECVVAEGAVYRYSKPTSH